MKLSLLLVSASLLMGSTAYASDLMVAGPGPIQYADPSHSWDGAYVGAFGGYGYFEPTFDGGGTDGLNPQDTLLGVDAGVNFTLGNGIVAGIVGDIAWVDATDEITQNSVNLVQTIDWAGSIRGRVGFDAGSFMPYLTAGLAFAHNNLDATTVPPADPDAASDDQTHIGWTVGAGVEVAVADHVSIDLLYRYSDYGTAGYSLGGFEPDMSLTSHQVSAGINFGF